MKFDLKTWIILALLAGIAILFAFWPSPKPSLSSDREEQYKIQAAILKLQIDSIQALQTAQNKKAVERAKKDSAQLAKKDAEISAIKHRSNINRAQVQPLIDSIPRLKAFVETQDSVIQAQDQQIDTLKSMVNRVRMDYDSMLGLEFIEDKLEAQMIVDCERNRTEVVTENEALKKENRKERRKGKLSRVLIPVGIAAGFVLGSQL